MTDPSRLRFTPKVIVNFTSPSGPTATQARAGLVIGMLDLLREMEQEQNFLAQVPEQLRDFLRSCVATTWIDAQDVRSVFHALDRTFPMAAGPARLGEALGNRLANSLFSALLSPFRAAGSDGVLLAVKQADRMWARIYQGGGLVVTQTGPKDLHIEVFGLPFTDARTFQAIHGAFIRGMFLALVRTCVVRKATVRTGHMHACAIEVSWV
ncbi:MAG TPA: hypothetical protein VI299_25455 [Polyangiales bacterium]